MNLSWKYLRSCSISLVGNDLGERTISPFDNIRELARIFENDIWNIFKGSLKFLVHKYSNAEPNSFLWLENSWFYRANYMVHIIWIKGTIRIFWPRMSNWSNSKFLWKIEIWSTLKLRIKVKFPFSFNIDQNGFLTRWNLYGEIWMLIRMISS